MGKSISSIFCLPMCMGFGCNAAGVVSTRIIESPRDRIIAILTNNFVPCNGRFPTIIMISSIFLTGVGTAFSSVKTTVILVVLIFCSVGVTFAVSKLLSSVLLRGKPSEFIIELPPYRKPLFFKVIIHGVIDKAAGILGRALIISAPAGAVIWLMQNVSIGSGSVMSMITSAMNPFASLIGLDGVILTAFLLGMPANEIVVPIIIMCYLNGSSLVDISDLSTLGTLFSSNGWSIVTALCMIVMTLNHFPCSTTLLTIKKETGSYKWSVFAFLIPTFTGLFLCFLLSAIAKLL